MDPRQWMGAVRMRVQTADKNMTIIHINPRHSSPSINILCKEVKSCVFVRNKSIKKIFFNIKPLLLTKYKSSIPNIAFPSEKVILSESGEKYSQIKHSLYAKTV